MLCFVCATEARLGRIKGTGCSKNPPSKDIIEGLDQIRTAQLHAASATVDNNLPYLRNCDYIEDMASSTTIMDAVRRKIAPEKHAVNEEELRSLIENDELRDQTVKLYSSPHLTDSTSAESCATATTATTTTTTTTVLRPSVQDYPGKQVPEG